MIVYGSCSLVPSPKSRLRIVPCTLIAGKPVARITPWFTLTLPPAQSLGCATLTLAVMHPAEDVSSLAPSSIVTAAAPVLATWRIAIVGTALMKNSSCSLNHHNYQKQGRDGAIHSCSCKYVYSYFSAVLTLAHEYTVFDTSTQL